MMNKQTLCWAVFAAVLCPLFLAAPNQSLGVTALHISSCLMLVSIADVIERKAR